MPALSEILSPFAQDVLEGLSRDGQKQLSSQYLYDDLGSVLFEAITLLPEYGLTRADERLLRRYALDIASAVQVSTVSELGSGSGRKTLPLLQGLRQFHPALRYSPIDVSQAALEMCTKELGPVAEVHPIRADWLEGLRRASLSRPNGPMLLLFLGSTIGNLPRSQVGEFLSEVRRVLNPGDYFLLGADLVKDVDVMLAAYDDPTGVTAAFNLNLLGRINRELGADFKLRSFRHEARWNEAERRIEMHLLSCLDQRVTIRSLDTAFQLQAGETIWTESSNKFEPGELFQFAGLSGFKPTQMWVDEKWPFAEALWQVPEQ